MFFFKRFIIYSTKVSSCLKALSFSLSNDSIWMLKNIFEAIIPGAQQIITLRTFIYEIKS